ncbi:hypothetical protein FSARC_3023 [Fusarium sarcochroum]|uniref:F-box domain-containing protein n=1 Tax=Fusarium sarcochroum TaxID=1208366 RepID=A0A8H4XC80_9HYPO|nr:hypothetical protein FSARC_3023 [Fusarium sarcochroum]
MPDLMSLPDEMLHQICVLISDTCRVMLFDVSRLNKRFHRIVSTLLIRHWPIRRWSHGQIAPARFALHLLHYPHLRDHVKSLVLDPIALFRDDDYEKVALDLEEMRELTVAAQDELPEMADSSSWCDELRQGGVDSIAALLLLWCTRLTHLDLVFPDFWPEIDENFFVLRFVTQMVNKLVAKGLQKPLRFHPLAKLRCVVLRGWNADISVPGQYAAPFFHLPKLKTLVGDGLGSCWPSQPLLSVGDDDTYDSDAESLPGPEYHSEARLRRDRYLSLFPIGISPVEELILEDLNLGFSGLFTLVRACRRLKKLVLMSDCYSMKVNGDNEHFLILSILHHSESLEELVLRLYEYKVGEAEEPVHGPMNLEDCFKDLHHLKRLTIDIEFLYPIGHAENGEIILDRLPPLLEHLRFEWEPSSPVSTPVDAQQKYIGDFQKLLKECGQYGHLSRLKSLDLSWATDDCSLIQGLDQLKMIPEEKGVRLHFGSWGSRGPYPPSVPEPNPPLP